MKRGDQALIKANWDEKPSLFNTCTVIRTSEKHGWTDIKAPPPFQHSKRVPTKNLKVVDGAICVPMFQCGRTCAACPLDEEARKE